jgi:hypothetical protein
MSRGSCLYELRRLSFKELRKLSKKLRQLFLGVKAAGFRSSGKTALAAIREAQAFVYRELMCYIQLL